MKLLTSLALMLCALTSFAAIGPRPGGGGTSGSPTGGITSVTASNIARAILIDSNGNWIARNAGTGTNTTFPTNTFTTGSTYSGLGSYSFWGDSPNLLWGGLKTNSLLARWGIYAKRGNSSVSNSHILIELQNDNYGLLEFASVSSSHSAKTTTETTDTQVDFSLAQDGTQKVFLRANATSGYVGINTNAPKAALHVNGDAIVDHTLYVNEFLGLSNAIVNYGFANALLITDSAGDGDFLQGSSSGDVPLWNGTTWVTGAQSGGGSATDSITNNQVSSATFTNKGVYMPVSGSTTTNIDWKTRDVFTNQITAGTTAVACLFSNVTPNRIIQVWFKNDNVASNTTISFPLTLKGMPTTITAWSNSLTGVAFHTADGSTNGFISFSTPPNTTNNFVSGQVYTNTSGLAEMALATIRMTNILSTDFAKMALWLDQDGDGTFERQGLHVSLGGVALLSDTEQLCALSLLPGCRFAFTNLSGGTAAATIEPNSSQWVRR